MDPFLRLKRLIGEDNLPEAIKELQSLVSTSSYVNELILHEARFNGLKRKVRMGTIPLEFSEVEENKLRVSLLELIDEIRKKEKSISSQTLSKEVKALLFEACRDHRAQIRTITTKDGWQIHTNNKVIFSNGTSRERIMWKDALSQLCNEGLLQRLDTAQKHSENFELTKRGFEVADSIPEIFFSSSPKFGLFTDPRDGQEYRTIELLGKVWLAQNLNFNTEEGCSFYDNDPANGEKYGRLYTWEAAHPACPPGWRLPTLEEFQVLVDNFGGSREAFLALVLDGISGFDALFAGVCHPEANFTGIGKTGSYWIDKEVDDKREKAFFFYFNSSQLTSWNINTKSYSLSVRCIRS